MHTHTGIVWCKVSMWKFTCGNEVPCTDPFCIPILAIPNWWEHPELEFQLHLSFFTS